MSNDYDKYPYHSGGMTFYGPCQKCQLPLSTHLDLERVRKVKNTRNKQSISYFDPRLQMICDSCIQKSKESIINNLTELFQEFKQTNRQWQETKLLTPKEFQQFFQYLTSLANSPPTSAFVTKTILGFNQEAPFQVPVMFRAEEASQLLKYFQDNVPTKDFFRYEHALGPNILNPYQMSQDFPGVIGHYYAYRPLTNKSVLLKQWVEKFKYLQDKIDIMDCPVCLEMINSRNEIAICNHCDNYYHKDSLHHSVKTSGQKCPTCRHPLRENEDVRYINFKLFTFNHQTGTGKNLGFKDLISMID